MKEMNLKLDIIEIKDVCFGGQNKISGGVLQVDKAGLLDYISDPVFTKLDVALAKPGESVRIIPVKDVIEPRIKEAPDGGYFPGYFGKFETCGDGVTKVLRGAAVVTTGTIVGFQEGVIDMSGIGAQYTQFSKLNNIVITADVKEGLHPAEHEAAVRVAGIKAAHYIAHAGLGMEADYTEEYCLPKPEKDLPKVAIMYMIMAQGLLHDNYVYGIDAKKLHTMLLHPNEVFDGAIVNGNCVVAGDKHTTYDHQNSPLVKEMFKRHGKTLDFKGLIVVPTYPGLADKQRCCESAVKMARLLDLDGVCIPEEGGGNPEADLMMICRGCEHHDIKTVMMLGPDGVEEPVADTTPEADAVINVGDCNEYIIVPPMDQVIGDQEQIKVMSGGSETSIQEDGGMRISLSAIIGSVNGFGTSNMSSYVR